MGDEGTERSAEPQPGPTAKKPPALFENPILLFTLLALSSAILCYLPLDRPLKALVLCSGVLGPLFISLISILNRPCENQTLLRQGNPSPPFPWLWVVPIALGIGLRLYRLTSLSLWPLWDESYFFSSAMDLCEKWNWGFFYTANHYPPLMIWALAFFFKASHASLTSLWLFSALLSLLTLLLLGWTAWRLFLPGPAFIFTCLAALSFWPLYTARFCNATNFSFLCQAMALWAAGLWTGKDSKVPSLGKILAAGLGLGLGFYAYYSWAVVFALALVYLWKRYENQRRRVFIPLAAACAAILAPLAWTQWRLPGSYVGYLWFWDDTWQNHLLRCLSYVTNLFWTHQNNLSGYAGYWGGFLNPLLTAGFFLGLLELAKRRQKFESRFLLFALVLCWLPAFLTNNLEMFRILQGLPFVLMLSAIGIDSLLSAAKANHRWKALGLLLLFSTAMDAGHLFIGYGSVWEKAENWKYKPLEAYRAYEILKRQGEELGPGYVLTEFGPLAEDRTLRLADYSFDAGQHPSLQAAHPAWAAVLTDANLEPFLRKRLPEIQWQWLSGDLRRLEGGIILGVIPFNPKTEVFLKDWVAADQSFQSMNIQDGYRENPDSPDQKAESFRRLQTLMARDPFIAACYYLKAVRENQKGDTASTLRLIGENSKRGYPSATFYFELGAQWRRLNKVPEAEAAFRTAVQCPGNRTSAAFQLARLQEKR